jgi:CelD/BcsL family acetyltransferase involved in cellulose biosynthesis
MELSIVNSIEGLASLAEEWNTLAEPTKSPLLRHEWFAACAVAFCPPGRLHVMVLRDGSGIAAIAPLVLNPSHGIRRLEVLGTAALGELSGFLYRDEAALEELVKAIHATGKPLYLQCILSDSPEAKALERLQPTTLRYGDSVTFSSPWVPVRMEWEKFLPTISSSWRSSFRRSQRKAEETGPLTFDFVTATNDTVESLFAEMFRIEASSWKARTGSAVETDKQLTVFFREYVKAAAALGKIIIAFMKIGDKGVASQLLVNHGGRLWVLKVGYDEAFSKASPGILLMHRVVQYTFENGYEAFEMLGANEPWVSIWKPEIHNHIAYRRYPKTPLPLIAHGIEESSEIVSRVSTIIKKNKGGIPWKELYSRLQRRMDRVRSEKRKED